MKVTKIKTRIRRDCVDAFRTIIWYAHLENHFFNRTSYEIAKLIEPELFGIDEDMDINHQIRWAKYKRGIHTPGKELINKANEHVNGTTNIINNVLWDALRGRKPLKWLMSKGVNKLSLDVQRIIFRSVNGQNELISVFHITRNLRRLQRLASFDALAALIIFLRIADDRNEREIALRIGRSIYRTLLVMTVFLPIAGFSYGLAFLLFLHVFPLCKTEMRQYDSKDVDEFFKKSRMLSNILLGAEDRNIIDLGGNVISKKHYTNFLFDIQDGKRGLEFIRVFFPSL